MNESEKRRRDLLRQTRKLYDENSTLPAVHPRYGHLIHELYEDEEKQPKGSFFMRAVLGALCFLCYVWIDSSNIEVADVSSNQIAEQIERQMDTETLKEVWRQL